MKTLIILAIIALFVPSTTHADQPVVQQFNNVQTATCNDSRVDRGFAFVTTQAQPNGYWQPSVGFAAYKCTDCGYSPALFPGFMSQTLFKNGNQWNGNGNVKPSDTITMVEQFDVMAGLPQTRYRYKMTITGINSPNGLVCTNPDGTSCSTVFSLKTQNGTTNICY
jgi:hypothetical protein